MQNVQNQSPEQRRPLDLPEAEDAILARWEDPDAQVFDDDESEATLDLAVDPERRIKFQADVQDYFDMSISSTINLPAWGGDLNNEDIVEPFADMLARYAHQLRVFTCYADGSRGGQPLTAVQYSEAPNRQGEELVETHDICDITGHGGSCGV